MTYKQLIDLVREIRLSNLNHENKVKAVIVFLEDYLKCSS